MINNIKCGILGIKESIFDAINDDENKINRITRAALPYFNFYGPFNKIAAPLSQLISIGENIWRGYFDLTYAVTSYQGGEYLLARWHTGRGVIEIAIVISSVVYYPLGMGLSTVLDLANETYAMGKRIQEEECTKSDVGIFLYKSSIHVLRLGTMLYAGPELLVVSIALQIFLEISQSYQEYQKERYIEAISKIGLALIRSYQVAPQVKEVYRKWTMKQPSFQSGVHSFPVSVKRAEGIERRAAIDVGSGGTKVLIVDVDTRTNEIVNVIFENSFSVPYQASLEKSPDGLFDSSVCEQGLKTFQEIQDLLNQHQVEKVSAIATEAFRKSNNGADFAKQVENVTKIPLRIISQQQEGMIAFNSALAMSKTGAQQSIVWDIGTGSFQITNQNSEKDYDVFTGGLGSVPFKNHIIENIQGRDPNEINTPNPISEEDYKLSGRYARSLARKAHRELKVKIKSPDITIIGIGRLFSNSVCPLVSDGSTIVRKGLRDFIRSSLNKDDQALNNPFAHVDLPNCIQVLEVMKALHIHEISVVNTTTTKGMVIGSEQDFTNWLSSQELC